MEWYLLPAIFLALLFVGIFTGIESAFAAVNRLSVELKKKQGLASGRILSRFLDEPAGFLGTMLIGSVFFTAVFVLVFSHFLDPFWKFLPYKGALGDVIRLFLELAAASLLILFFTFFFKGAFKAKSITAPHFTNFFYSFLNPLSNFFVRFSVIILKVLFDVRMSDKKGAFVRVDIEHFLQQNREPGQTQDMNRELFENALSLRNVKVRQCLVPRKEIEAVEITASMEEIRRKFMDTKLTRLVVYENNIDTLLGYIHQLELFKKPVSIQSILIPLPAVPESMGAIDLINKLIRERKSMAWVVDEFGGTSGIITMEDLLEEIFGEIQDEYDIDEFVEKQLSENEYIFSGRLELDYLNEKYHLDFPENESETLSGYIINLHETIPKLKERIIIEDYEFDILSVNETRIETVKMKILK